MNNFQFNDVEMSFLLSCIFKAKFGGDVREEYLFNEKLVELYKKILAHAQKNYPDSQLFQGRGNQPFTDLLHSEIWADMLPLLKGISKEEERVLAFRTAIFPFLFDGDNDEIRAILGSCKEA